MVDGVETILTGIAAYRLEIEVPVLAGGFQKIQQAAADAADRRNFEFARPDRLLEGERLQRLRARHGPAGIIDIHSDGADPRTMRDVMRVRETIRLAIDDEFDMALRPALDILTAMRPGLAKAELAE